MNILVLSSGHNDTLWNYFEYGKAVFAGTSKNNSFQSITKHCGKLLDAIAIKIAFGGSVFKKPVLATAEAISKLEKLVPDAPFHLPPALELIKRCSPVFRDVPIVLIFETAFFAHLPARESMYGIDVNIAEKLGLRRFGFNGIYHEAACDMIRRLPAKRKSPARIISICLENQPEIAAVIGNHPVMVSSGATPLEGIPGQTSCGQLDPSLVLTLAEKKHWGPEQINNILTQESGILGLTGKKLSLEDVFKSESKKIALARQIITYRVLLACGAAMAAMGGLDAIIFSGKSAQLGKILGPHLVSKL